MKIRRTILTCRSKFYYYTLLFIGSTSILFFVRCSNQNYEEKYHQLRDSVSKAKIIQDSIKKTDSVSSALKQKFIQDSTAKADSLAKANRKKSKTKPVNPIVPKTQPSVMYGVVPFDRNNKN